MPQLLHGILLGTIYEVDNLNSGCGFKLRPKKSGKGFLAQVKRLLLGQPEIVGSKVYATVDLDKTRVGRTSVTKKEMYFNPQWHESFHIYCAHYISNIIFSVKVVNPVGETLIGRAYVSIEGFIKGDCVLDKWVHILNEEYKPLRSKIHVKLQFLDATKDRNWSRGISSSQFEGVPNTYFKQRQGCKVTLYEDAHVSYDNVRDTTLCDTLGLQNYERKGCWEDIFDAISNAKHLIYITGWSVYTKITLIKDQNTTKFKEGGNITLGELLQKKGKEGVTVLMLVWDDGNSVVELKKDGMMATCNQETEEYFRNTNVKCFLVPRNPEDGTSTVQGFQISTMFSHHQRTIVVDSEAPGERSAKRRIVGFVGGIDLCGGRYDTPEHPLFETLNTTHHDDFYQPNFAGSSIKKGGPREPWHDIHCKLEGPVAWDVLHNFDQRWKKQVGDDFLIPFCKLDEIVIHPSRITTPDDTETWNVQLFRSIDGGVVFDFPENPQDADGFGLVCGKDNVIDRSIHDAYVSAIRRAKNFIYIENQYFLGSSFSWKPNGITVEDIGALHLIPKELSLKIVSKIEAGERFTVYIVIPMWPEGVPESASVQAILDWQRRTMEMMYTDIIQALQRKGLRANPKDYLTFFCLGNREKKGSDEYEPTEKPQADTDYGRAQEARRFMIYVHAKMMIVDDEYIIIGSANINQRSMDGGKDSEIAMGAFQPHYLATTHPARGQVYRFRMLLWLEHLGMLHEAFQHPESVHCVELVNDNAHKNWEIYSKKCADDEVMSHAHLLRYPIEITKTGAITTMPEFEFFPDTKASVLGSKSDYLPPILTT